MPVRRSPAPLRVVPSPRGGAVAKPGAIRVALADDHAFARRSLRRLLDSDDGLEVVAEAGDLVRTLRHLHDHRPHVVVMDVTMPGGSNLATIRRVRSEAPDTDIVVTTMIDDPGFARAALAAGASGYVLKDSADDELPTAIRNAARGESYITPRLAATLSAYGNGRDPLTERELDVLRLIALGHTNAEMARMLGISMRTVETHRAHIHRKLGVATRAELVRYALRRGLLPLPAAPADRA